MKTPLAITTSDWHLRTTVPGSRAESSWFPVMEKQINKLRKLAHDLSGAYGRPDPLPILVAGDVFDRCDPPSSIVTWAIEALRGLDIYAIPGQHDLLGHRYDERFSGAYGALVRSATIKDIPAGKWTHLPTHCAVYGAPWGVYDPPAGRHQDFASVILLHKYVYINNETKYVGAADSGNITNLMPFLEKCDVLAIGDNHIAWKAGKAINHGSLFQLTTAQTTHRPRIGIVYHDGSLDTQYLDEDNPQWHESAAVTETSEGVKAFVENLKNIQTDSIQFMEILEAGKENLSEPARAILGELRDHIKAS